MPVIEPEADLAEPFRLYLAGESAMKVAGQFGISNSTFVRRLKAAGIPVRPKGDSLRLRADRENVAFLADFPEAIRRYEEGEPAIWLAKEFGVGYHRFVRLLAQAGIQPRTVRENLAAMYASMSADERRTVVSAAHAAKRGRPANEMSLERRAQTMQRTMQLASRFDLLLGLWLAQRGLEVTPQKAIGRYNVDLAINELLIAVEVNGSGHGTLGDKWTQRCQYLFDCGWRIIEVRVKGPISDLRPEAADNVIALAEQVCAGESGWGQYTVIGGDGEALPAITDKRHNRSPVAGPKAAA